MSPLVPIGFDAIDDLLDGRGRRVEHVLGADVRFKVRLVAVEGGGDDVHHVKRLVLFGLRQDLARQVRLAGRALADDHLQARLAKRLPRRGILVVDHLTWSLLIHLQLLCSHLFYVYTKKRMDIDYFQELAKRKRNMKHTWRIDRDDNSRNVARALI